MNINKDIRLSVNQQNLILEFINNLDSGLFINSFKVRTIKKIQSCKSNNELQAFLNKLNQVLGLR